MKRIAIMSVLLALVGCQDQTESPVAPPTSIEPSLSSADEERVGQSKPGGFSAASGLTTQQLSATLTATDLAQALVGAGVTVSNVQYHGAASAAGTFQGGTGIIGFESGIILSSGNIQDVVGPNQVDGVTTLQNTPGDPQLSALTGRSSLDAAILQFDFVPNGDKVFIEYVFSSDEYNEYVHSSFDDAFAFFVNGQNCAVTPSGQRVSINTINGGMPFGAPNAVNPGLYRNNDDADRGSINTEMDGLTTVLVCQASVNTGETNTMRLSVSDMSDRILDSNVFIKAGSFSTTPPPAVNEPPTAHPNGPYTGQEGSAVSFDGSASADADGSITSYEWDFGDGNTASGANPSHAYADNGVYVVSLTVTDDDNATHSMSTTATIENVAPTAAFGNNGPVDEGSPFELSLTGAADPSSVDVGAGFEYAFDCGSGYGAYGSDATASCPTTDDGTPAVKGKIRDKDGGETEYAANVTIHNVAPSVDAGGDVTLTSGEDFAFSGSFTDPGADSPWATEITWGVGSPTMGSAAAPGVVTATSPTYLLAGTYTVTLAVTDDHDTGSDSRSVTVLRLALGIDIKPGSDPNSINLNTNGSSKANDAGANIAVAVLGSASFDASLVNAATVTLGDTHGTDTPVAKRNNGSLFASLEDVDKDGRPDMVMHFDRDVLIANGDLTQSTTSLTMLGDLTDGRQFTGSDAVRIVP